MDPSRLRRWIASKFMTSMTDLEKLKQKRRKQERGRIKRGAKHIVEYFHQVDDGYSHLAAQALKALTEKYDIELECHLVSGPLGANAAALNRGDKIWEADIDGSLWSQQTFAYQGKCLEWIKGEFKVLSQSDQESVNKLLAGTGCEALLI